MNRHTYRVEPKLPKGYAVMLTAQVEGEPEGAAVEIAAFVDRIEANAKAVELVTADRDKGVDARLFQALQ